MLKHFVPIVFLVVASISCNQRGGVNDTTQTFNESSYEEKVMSIEEQEKADPVRFLKGSANYRENIWGDKFVIDLTITNTATVADYKDVVVEYSFYSQTNTLLGTKRFVYYQNVFHGKSITLYDQRIEKEYSAAKVLGVEVVRATPL